MPTQERLLRELVACNGCPKFNKAITAAVGDTDPASLLYEQLLQILQSLPVTEYCGSYEAEYRALRDAMRAGDDPELINSLAAELVNQVSSSSSSSSSSSRTPHSSAVSASFCPVATMLHHHCIFNHQP